MTIQEQPLTHWINNFYGYGSWKARMWFVAYEEGGGDLPEEVADKLNYFYTSHSENAPQLCNIREMYKQVAFNLEGPKEQLFSSLYDYRFDDNAIQHGVWKNLISFVHSYLKREIPDRLEYQKKYFVSATDQNEALIRLFPLPSPHNHAWYYSWLQMNGFDFLKSREKYEAHIYQRRVNTLLTNIAAHKPEVVLLYGMNNINTLKKSVQEFFPGATFKMVKAIKQQIPQHHATHVGETKLIITTQIPALRHNRIETGFDWEEFGKLVRNY